MAEKTLAFTKVKYDSTDIPPDAPGGRWNALLKVKKSTTDRAGKVCPMLILEWTLKECILDEPTDEHEKALGTSTSDYLGFVPKGDKWEKGCKQKLRDLAKLFDIDLASLPTIWRTWEDFGPLIEALDGQMAEITTLVKEKDGEKRTEVRYTKPSGAVPALKTAAEDDDEDDDDEPKPAVVKGKKTVKKAVVEEEDDEDEEEAEEEEEEEADDEDEDEEDEPPPPPVAKKKVVKKK